VKTLVRQLVDKKKEGTWWDFKREHHENQLDLLHDILCLANAIHSGDRYLIIGVSDNYEYIDVNKGKIRRKQSDIIDLLKSKKFADDNVPVVSMESVSINTNEIDIITIKNKRKKPYYILDDYKKGKKCLRSGVVYNRVGDTNTPNNRCANPNDVELMWKERFGLTLTAEERYVEILLDFRNWRYDGISKAYYTIDPDYSLEIEQDDNGEGQCWWQNELVEKTIGSIYFLKYKDKDVYSLPVKRFHSENLCFPLPDVEYVAYPDDKFSGVSCYCDLFHYTKGTIKYSLFFHIRALEVGGNLTAKSFCTPLESQIKPPIISLPFLIFESDKEKKEALKKLKDNINDFKCNIGQTNGCERQFCEWAYKKIKGK